ncbi:hypothetical protein VP1G_11057 [Cytospora mali]|uniref:Uncharacterized protein n=1 Tax=Cytospora mali TaxID=578113 RepID=A0A194V522_CYTMA|nr:hypothetical protein VP1G_11057 [Valsa mali var. pyri (nom. inval.)]
MTHSHKQSNHGKHRSHGSHGSSSSGNSNGVYISEPDGGRQKPVRREIVWSWNCVSRRCANVVKEACPTPVLRVATDARCTGVNNAAFIRLMFTLTDTKEVGLRIVVLHVLSHALGCLD